MEINKFTYFSYLSIKSNILLPLKKFMSNGEVLNSVKEKKFEKKFFPMPFFLAANEKDILSIKDKKIEIKFHGKTIDFLKISSVSMFKKDELIDVIFEKKKNISNHPFIKFIKASGNYLIETKEFAEKKGSKKLSRKKFIGFATRNVPHKGHEKIILHHSERNNLKIIIFEDSSGNKIIDSTKTFNAYKKFIKKNSLEKKILLKKIKMPSFLLGPRQAAIHALIGKNLGCEKFIIGRDHSGYKNFYNIFESYNFCKKNEKIMRIKIIESGSPIYCYDCKKIVFRKDYKCKNFIDISGSFIRKLKNKRFKKILSNF